MTKPEVDKIAVVSAKNPSLGKQLTAALELRDSLTEGKSAEQKALENMIATTPDEALKKSLNDRLATIKTKGGAKVPDVLRTMEQLNISVGQIIRLGLSKFVSQTCYGYAKRSETPTNPNADFGGDSA